MKIEFNYFTINDALNAHHPNLSGYWSTLDWNDEVATITYMMEDGGDDETVIVDRQGNVKASPRLIREMEEIG